MSEKTSKLDALITVTMKLMLICNAAMFEILSWIECRLTHEMGQSYTRNFFEYIWGSNDCLAR